MYSIEMQTFKRKLAKTAFEFFPLPIQKKRNKGEEQPPVFPILNLSLLKLLPVSQFYMQPFQPNHGQAAGARNCSIVEDQSTN